MPALPITFACGLYDRMLALYTGEVKPEGIDLNFLAIDDPREIFDRMAKTSNSTPAEMSSSEFISRHARRQLPVRGAAGVSVARVPPRLHHRQPQAASRSPKDLEGKRIGMPLYTMTAAIFIRGMLQHEYGVDLSRATGCRAPPTTPAARRRPARCRCSSRSASRQPHRQIALRTAGGRRDRGHHRHRLPKALEHAIPTSAAVSRLSRGRDGILPAHEDLSDHASRRASRATLYERIRSSRPASSTRSAKPRTIALKKMRDLGTLRYMLPWMAAESTRSTRCSAAIPGPTASSPTGRRSKRWCNTWPSSR